MRMTGRDGVLSLGPLSMTKVMRQYLEQQGTMEECIPKSFQDFWRWNGINSKRKNWARVQARLFYRNEEDIAKHSHYSQLTTPIVMFADHLNASCSSHAAANMDDADAARDALMQAGNSIAAEFNLTPCLARELPGEVWRRPGCAKGDPDKVLWHATNLSGLRGIAGSNWKVLPGVANDGNNRSAPGMGHAVKGNMPAAMACETLRHARNIYGGSARRTFE